MVQSQDCESVVPLWSKEIQNEWTRNLLRKQPDWYREAGYCSHSSQRPTTRQPLCPPKPKLLESATLIVRSLAVSGV